MPPEKRKPYIGVTGIATPEEARFLSQAFDRHLPASHQGMAGVLVSSRTLSGANEKVEKYPPLDSIPAIFAETKAAAFNTIHFRTKQPESLVEDVTRLFDHNHLYDARIATGIQLNMLWPDPAHLDQIKNRMPDLQIVLQLGTRALNQSSRMDIANSLTEYADLVDYVLLDPSGGIGRPFDTDDLVPYFQTSRHMLPGQPIIFAGGFNNLNVTSRLTYLYNRIQTTDFGIDAEGGLRVDRAGKVHGGTLSLDRTESYVRQASAFFTALYSA